MCDYCDCRSHGAIASLSEEHETLLGLTGRLRRAVDAGDATAAASLAEDVHRLLHHHARREEAGVFAELRDADVDPRYVERFENDHIGIHALLHPPLGPTWRDEARALIGRLEGHIHDEEYDLFPSAHQILAPAAWDRVDAVHARPDRDAAPAT